MTRIGFYPGTFDPITNGHTDIIGRAVKLVDRLVIGVAINIGKGPMFSLDERVAILEEAVEPLRNRAVDDQVDDRTVAAVVEGEAVMRLLRIVLSDCDQVVPDGGCEVDRHQPRHLDERVRIERTLVHDQPDAEARLGHIAVRS